MRPEELDEPDHLGLREHLLECTDCRRALEIVRASGDRGVTVSALRAELGTSRKYAVPLMEHLDRTGVTRREGDLRFARAATRGPVP